MAANPPSDEEKKDLTNLLLYADQLKKSGQAPVLPKGAVMEEIPIEKIDDFESLADYSASHPAPPPSEEPAAPAEGSDTPSEFSFEPSTETSHGSQIDPSSDFPITPETDPGSSDNSPPPTSDFASEFASELASDFAPESSPEIALENAPEIATNIGSDFTPPPDTEGSAPPHSDLPSEEFSSSELNSDFSSDTGLNPQYSGTDPSSLDLTGPEETPSPETPLPAPEIETKNPQASPSPTQALPQSTLEKVKTYAEQLQPARPLNVPAAFPFSLLIEGEITPEEREKLLDLLAHENMGIREIDLEPQFAAGKILLPRISEYACVLIVQALRGTRADIRLGPSDTIFATEDTRNTDVPTSSAPIESRSQVSYSAQGNHPAKDLPVLTSPTLPPDATATKLVVPIDTLTATAVLQVKVVEAENSTEYQEVLEALQRELKHRAYHRGANAILNFKIQLDPLSSPTHYRVLATGMAVQIRDTGPPPEATLFRTTDL